MRRAAFCILLHDPTMPQAAAPQIGLILTNLGRREDQDIAAILPIVSSYYVVCATAD
jgi:hypothetical protein